MDAAALAAYASLAVVCAASLAVGQAILSVSGRPGWSWLAGPVGLAAILVASGIAIKLPGHGTAVAIALVVLLFLSIATLALGRRVLGGDPANVRSGIARTVRGMDAERSPGTHPAIAAASAVLAVAAASIPFAVNGRVGVLGVGLVNDDMANHLLIADWLNHRLGEMPALVDQGYPVGPHAVVAGLVEGLGAGPIEAFAGLTLAIPALTALVAFEALGGVRRPPRVIAAALVALPYLAAAYLAQEAFKEPAQALLVLAFALLLPGAVGARRAIPLGVVAAGSVYAYSFPGLFWLAGTAAVWLLVTRRGDRVTARPQPGMPAHGDAPDILGRGRARHPATLPVAAAALALLVVLTAPDLGRIADFTDFRAFRESTIGGGLGNLRHQLSPLEALGVWPASDFRLSAGDASGPAVAFYLGALIAAAALVLALPRWIRRHGPAVPAALAAAIVVYLGALLLGTVYTSAKALAVAAPLVSLIAFGGLLAREPRGEQGGAGARAGHRRLLRPLLALALAAGMALSSFLVLRQAPVGPGDHADQLAELRPLVQGHDVLFLGRDNFVAYELRGARAFTAVRNYYAPHYVRPNLRLEDVFRKFDFDSVTPRTLARFPYVITTRAAYASGPPPAFRPLRRTADFVLWRRTGPVGVRRTLAEGAEPGAIAPCPASRRGGRGGRATVFARPPVSGGRWAPGPSVEDGSPATQALRIPSGSWAISIQYDSTRPVRVTAPGMDATLPANLDYRGSVPYYPVGELTVRRPGPVRFTVAVERPPLVGRLLGTSSQAHLGAIAASPAGPGGPLPGEGERRVALGQACGRYLDWYRPDRAAVGPG